LHPGSIPGEASIAAADHKPWDKHLSSGTRDLTMSDFAAARRNMVDTQLRTYDVTSHRLLDAVESVPREIFVPASLQGLAYTDRAVSVDAGGGASRALLQPMVLARLLQAIDIRRGDRFLDVGGGSGYGAALAAALGASVTALEASEDLAALARGCLSGAGFGEMPVVAGALGSGHPAAAPYDVVMIHGACEVEPADLLGQLADGGRLGVVMGRGRAGRATVFTRNGGVIGRRGVFDAAAAPLADFQPTPAFAL
jgi:protein-L-isoaspartate(D-aspartate) O-methyltransferase